MRLSLPRLLLKEARHRWGGLVLAAAVLAANIAVALTADFLLRHHDHQEETRTAELEEAVIAAGAAHEDAMRRSMLHLGFNILILPKDLDLDRVYLNDFDAFMPESHVDTLANSKIVTVRHLLPSLHAKVEWPERRRTVILVGTRGEVPLAHKRPKKPLVQPVPPGSIVLGYELHRSLELSVGDELTFMGRSFTVSACHEERGNRDDISAWIDLATAQELLGRAGQINAILALECKCAWADLAKVRQEIGAILPDTRVVERVGEALARAEARQAASVKAEADLDTHLHHAIGRQTARRQLAHVLTVTANLAGVAVVLLLAILNVRDRRREIAVLRACGAGSRLVLTLVLGRQVLIGVAGGVLGLGLALGLVAVLSPLPFATLPRDLLACLAALVLTPAWMVVIGWFPARHAAALDPAAVLREAP